MKKIISSIIIVIMTLLSFSNYTFAAGQLQATIEITPSVTEVVAGDKVTFTFATKNIVNSIDGTITAIAGVIEYNKNFFKLVTGGLGAITVGEDTGMFNTMTVVEEGGINGIITLEVLENPTGSGVVKFTNLEAGDGRTEDAETLGVAKTPDQEFTITIKDEGGDEIPCEHTGTASIVDNKDGTHSKVCEECGEKFDTDEHTYEDGVCTVCNAEEPEKECKHDTGTVSAIDNKDGTHSRVCEVCGEIINTERHSYKDGNCEICNAKQEEEDCEHTYDDYVDNKDGKHSAECTKCGEKYTEEHTYENGICTKCKATQPAGGNDDDGKKDTTTADKEIPKAGLNTMLFSVIAIITVVAIVMYRKNKNYQDIK